jgi:hypothetical protein
MPGNTAKSKIYFPFTYFSKLNGRGELFHLKHCAVSDVVKTSIEIIYYRRLDKFLQTPQFG